MFSFDFPAVGDGEAIVFEHIFETRAHFDQCSGNSLHDSVGLTHQAAALHLNIDINIARQVGIIDRPNSLSSIKGVVKIIDKVFAVDGDFSGAFGDGGVGHTRLPLALARVLEVSCFKVLRDDLHFEIFIGLLDALFHSLDFDFLLGLNDGLLLKVFVFLVLVFVDVVVVLG